MIGHACNPRAWRWVQGKANLSYIGRDVVLKKRCNILLDVSKPNWNFSLNCEHAVYAWMLFTPVLLNWGPEESMRQGLSVNLNLTILARLASPAMWTCLAFLWMPGIWIPLLFLLLQQVFSLYMQLSSCDLIRWWLGRLNNWKLLLQCMQV